MTVISDQLRAKVVERANDRCEYCQLPQALQAATCQTGLDNLALACTFCNASKWTHVKAIDPATGQRVELFHPRRHRWIDHFRWSLQDKAILEPSTPMGRATAALLDLNSPRRIAIRRWMLIINEPPSM